MSIEHDIAAGRKHMTNGGSIHIGQESYCGICSGVAISNDQVPVYARITKLVDALKASQDMLLVVSAIARGEKPPQEDFNKVAEEFNRTDPPAVLEAELKLRAK